MDFPLVSIITPSYNQAEYLEFTIQSVLAQKYPNLEYIIVDGGSTDGSVEIIQKYADQLSWWVSESDDGQADAINKGFRRASGEVVAWLNSDDLYLPGAIHEAVSALQADPDLGMVFGDALTIDPLGKPINQLVFGNWGLTELMRFRIICQPAVFMRRPVLMQAGGLDENFHYMLDHHLWLRIASNSQIKYIPKIWAAARHHPEAKNVSLAPKFSLETYKVFEWMKTQPDFEARVSADLRRVSGGAHRLAARYYLDGDQNWNALKAYSKALIDWPSYALKHWHRMAFTAANLVGLGNFIDASKFSRRKSPVLGTHACKTGRVSIKQVTKDREQTYSCHRRAPLWHNLGGKDVVTSSEVAYISEPLNVHHRPGVLKVPTQKWYTYICEQNQSIYLSALQETLGYSLSSLARNQITTVIQGCWPDVS